MRKIRILKKSREIEFPEGITKAELVSILLKWAPKITNDDDLSAYGATGFNPNRITEEETDGANGLFNGVYDMINELGDIKLDDDEKTIHVD